jgi:hypothetical protein
MPFYLRMTVLTVLRVMLTGACCFGIWYSWRAARADFLFQEDDPRSVREAIVLAPDNWKYYMRLAQFDRPHARELLDTALRLDPYNAQAAIELALQYETEGDYPQAEKLPLKAFAVDRTYTPRWSLANYYFRRDNMPAFWEWARRAAEMPAYDIGPLFELCWRASPDAEKISQALLNNNPDLIRQYLGFLLSKDQLSTAASVAAHLLRAGAPETDRQQLLITVNRLTEAGDGTAASSLWRLMTDQHWVVADTGVPNNGDFLREPVPVSFDWLLPEYAGLHSWPGSSGLETEFTGNEPEDCVIAEQTVFLTPGDYTMTYSYHTTDIPPGTGIRWQVVAPTNQVLAATDDLSSDAPARSTLQFTVPPGASLLRLRLGYRRELGTPRISGMLLILSIQIQPHPQK